MKRVWSFPVLFYVVLFLFLLGGWILLRSSLPAPAPLSPKEQQEVEELKKFKAQSNHDHLICLTDNSFFGPELKPLSGKPVLLAAGVEQWDGAVDDESGEVGDMVEFEVIQGNGKLAFFLDLQPGKAPPATQVRLQMPAMGSYEAFVWLLTPPGETGEVVVRARLVLQGERAIFMDPQSQVLFHVRPTVLPRGLRIPSARTLAERSFRKDKAPHAEVVERDVLGYPGGQGVFSSDLKGIWFGSTQARVFHTDASGKVLEADKEEEKNQWAASRQRWNGVLPDLQGILTHLDKTGKDWGFLSYSEISNAESGADGFRPARWIFEKYRGLMPEAGPEEQATLNTYQEDPEKPVEVGIHQVHRSVPLSGPTGSVWGQTLSWSSEVANIHHIYGTILEERKAFLGGKVTAQQAADLLKKVIQTNRSEEQSHEISWPGMGCTLRDFEPSMEGQFRQYGHPPGLVVGSVESSSPAAHLGLQTGDMVVLVNWQRVSNVTEVEKLLKEPEPEEGWPLLFWRKGVYQMYRAQLP